MVRHRSLRSGLFRLENRRGHSEAIVAVNLEFTLNLELKFIEIIAKMFVALMFHENNASNRFFNKNCRQKTIRYI